MLQKFEIIPFHKNDVIDSFRGEIDIRGQEIIVSYQLAGEIDEVFWPDQHASPTRESGLWQRTCLEFFIGPVMAPHYWEFNLCPNGNWNCFSFSDLRCDRQESDALVPTSARGEVAQGRAQCVVTVQCKDAILEEVRIGISAVIEHKSGLLYYALAHNPKQKIPDFHARENHLLLSQLPANESGEGEKPAYEL